MRFDRPEDLAFYADQRRRRRLGLSAPRQASSPAERLERAGELLAGAGWVGPDLEPWCRDARGGRVHHQDEGLARYSLSGALQAHGVDVDATFASFHRIVAPASAALSDFVAAWAPLPERLEVPYGDDERLVDDQAEERWWELQAAADGELMFFGDWLTAPGRTVQDLLRLLDLAAKEVAV